MSTQVESPMRGYPRNRLIAPPSAEPEDWWRVRASLASAIIAAATPERDDRLFPGDIQQFTSRACLRWP